MAEDGGVVMLPILNSGRLLGTFGTVENDPYFFAYLSEATTTHIANFELLLKGSDVLEL